MEAVFDLLRRLVAEDDGISVAEYGMVIAVFAIAILSALKLVESEASVQLVNTQTNLTSNGVNPP